MSNDKVNISVEQLVSSTKMVRNLSHCLGQALINPIFIQRGQEVKWVLMSLDEYRKRGKKK